MPIQNKIQNIFFHLFQIYYFIDTQDYLFALAKD